MNWKKKYKILISYLMTKKVITEKIDSALYVFKETENKLNSVNEVIELKKDRIDEAQEQLRIQKDGLNKQFFRIKETIIKIKGVTN